MSDEAKRQLGTDSRPIYESPRALRLGDARTGSGGFTCEAPGSGDVGGQCIQNGTGAGGCEFDGNSAGACLDSGNSALNN